MLIESIKEKGEEVERQGDKTLYHFESGIIVNSPNFSGIFYDIVVETGKIVLFDGISPFARVVQERDWKRNGLSRLYRLLLCL